MLYKIKTVYAECFAKKYSDPFEFVNSVASNLDHEFWVAGRDFASEILSKSNKWHYLSEHVDDYAGFMENEMRKKLSKWIWNIHFEKSTLAYRMNNTESAARWLLDRYVNELKNLFDPRYKNHIEWIQFASYKEKNI